MFIPSGFIYCSMRAAQLTITVIGVESLPWLTVLNKNRCPLAVMPYCATGEPPGSGGMSNRVAGLEISRSGLRYGITREFLRQDLDRHFALELEVARAIEPLPCRPCPAEQ
jgi:hypothetical protein